jgi:hypothetical protein
VRLCAIHGFSRAISLFACRNQAADTKGDQAMTQLPPDPENMNADRASWAEATIRQFQIVTGTDWDDCVKDLLCDLMHFCDRHTFQDGETSFDFEAALATARMHYEAETTAADEMTA